MSYQLFDQMRQEFGEIRRRARMIEAEAVRGDELKQVAGQIATGADRLVRLLEDLQRDVRRARRDEQRSSE